MFDSSETQFGSMTLQSVIFIFFGTIDDVSFNEK